MSQEAYNEGSFAEAMTAQYTFPQNFNLNNPQQAAAEYARIMHAHTQQQLSMVSRSGSRRKPAPSDGANPTPSMSSANSTDSSSPDSSDS